MPVLTIDFETYYDKDYGLKKLTTEEYLRDPRFEVIGVAVAVDHAKPEWFSGTWREISDWLKQFDINNNAVLAHNAMFDCAILAWHFATYPKFILDTLSMARPRHAVTVGGSLAALSTHYGDEPKGTEVVDALGKRRLDFTPEELAAYGAYCCKDVRLTRNRFHDLRPIFTKAELLLIDNTIRMFTEPRLQLDQELLTDYKEQIAAERAELVAEAEAEVGSLRSNPQFAAALERLNVVPPTKVSPTTGQETYAFSKQDQEFTDLLEHPNRKVRALVNARLNVRSTLEETRTQRFIDIASRGPLPIPLSYCGANTTWRWAGTQKVNLQNLRGGGTLRRAIRAYPGHAMAGGDLSNIELRVTHALAGREESLEALRAGRDLYIEFAAILFKRDPDELQAAYDAGDKEAARQRKVGKVAHLGLGYGCGHVKFQHMCRMAGIPLTLEQSKAIVERWRATYAEVPRLWREADRAIASAFNGECVAVGAFDLVTTGHVDDGVPGFLLPGKHFIRYDGLTRDDEGWRYNGRNKQTKRLYGGAAVENLSQSLARHVLADQWGKFNAWLRTHAPQWRVVLQVHDEITAVGPKQDAELVAQGLEACLTTPPAWWAELPLAAEVHIGQTFADMK